MTREEFRQHIAPWLALHDCVGIGALRASLLLKHFGSPADIFAQPIDVLSDALGSRHYAQSIHQSRSQKLHALADTSYTWLSSPDVWGSGVCKAILTQHDLRYPASLKEIDDPPLFLYALGASAWLDLDAPLWWQAGRGMLAIVGSRAPTAQGVLNASRLGCELQQAGLCIVSGLARGIDAAAHDGALKAATGLGPATVAVMGTGIDRIYPHYHQDLAQRIARNGLLLTEQVLGAGPLANNFPKRNRIITGLSQATLVVEAAEQSGSLISARLAAEQGRDVMAIPGSIHSPQSKGCHWLIKQGAKLVENAADILEDFALAAHTGNMLNASASSLEPAASEATSSTKRPPSKRTGTSISHTRPLTQRASSPTSDMPEQAQHTSLPASSEALLQAIGYDPIHFEALQARTGLSTASLQARLLELELEQRIQRMPGNIYQRIERA